MEKAWQQEQELVTWHPQSGSRDAGVQLVFLFLFSPVPQPMEQCHLYAWWVFHLNLPSLEIPSETCPEVVSIMILNSHQIDNQDQFSWLPS